MLVLIFIMVFASCFMLLYTIISLVNKDNRSIASRLDSIKKSRLSNDDEELNQPLLSRVIRPMLDQMGRVMMKITPGEMISSLENKIIKAGSPGNLQSRNG
jgi:tight adherence protein C